MNKKKWEKTIKLTKETHARLKRFARKDETFDDVINRLLDIAEGRTGQNGGEKL